VPPLYPREHEVIHSELTVLRYRIRIRIIEVQDWTSRPPPSDDEALGDSGNDPDWGFGGVVQVLGRVDTASTTATVAMVAPVRMPRPTRCWAGVGAHFQRDFQCNCW